MQIINGRKLRDEILTSVKAEIAQLRFQPVFCDVLVGRDPASVQYVEMKKKTAEKVGILFRAAEFPEDISTDELIVEIKKLNLEPNMCGIIVQLPLSAHIDKGEVLNSIDPELDVDCLGRVASEKFYKGETGLGYPTALACMAVLDSIKLNNLDSKTRIAILGQGMLVGKPVTAMLKFRGLTPTPVDRQTANKEEIIKTADIIISGMGEGQYITGDMIKSGAVVIDAGTSEENGAIVGDVDASSVSTVAGYLSPVPGGVGPVTVAVLLQNVLNVAKKKSGMIE